MQRWYFLFFLFTTQLPADTVLVLPFSNHSKTPNLDWVGESIAESVREALSSEGVLVLGREDRVEAYKRLSIRPTAVLTRASIIKVGEVLDASLIVYGDYDIAPAAAGASSKGSLHVRAHMIDRKHTRPGPEFDQSGPLEDLAAVEHRMGWQALHFIAPKTAPPEAEFTRNRPPVRLDALESYIRGLLATSAEQKHRYFTQAARLDERYSQPCFQLGRISFDKKDYPLTITWLSRVNRSDSHYMEAQFLLALARYYTRDFVRAEKELQMISESVPLNEVLNNLGAVQLRLNQNAAIETFRRAVEGDPADPDYHFNLAYALWKSGKFDEAATSFRAALERRPDDSEATALLGRCLRKDGPRPGDPRSEGRERVKMDFEETAWRQLKAELQMK